MKKLIMSVIAGLASMVHDWLEVRRAVNFISMTFGVEAKVYYDWIGNLMEAGLWIVIVFLALYAIELVTGNILAEIKWTIGSKRRA